MNDKTLHITGNVISKADLPDELKAAEDDADVWGYASVEQIDRDADIVRVKGIKTSLHRPESPIKLLAGHLRILPNGESPIIGRVTGFKHVTHKSGVPALAFGAKFASTPLGKSYKALYGDGVGPDFSIGFRPIKAEPMKDGGFDYTESELLEVSCVTVPANEMATVLRELEGKPAHEMTVKVDTEVLQQLLKSIQDEFTKFNLRLDDIEDAIAARSHEAEQSAGHNPPPSEKSESEPPLTVADLLGAINALKPRK